MRIFPLKTILAFPVRIFPLKTIWILRPLGLLESKHGIMQHAWLVRDPLVDSGQAPRACTVSGLESIRAFPSESKHGIMRHVQLTRNSLVHTDKSSPCMHSVWLGVDSGVPVRKQTRHHVARVAREGILMWIRTKLPVHALSLDRSRFGRSRQKANTASCTDLHKLASGLLLFEIFITSQLGSSGLTDVSTDTTHKNLV